MMRGGASLNPNQARLQLLEERQDVAPLQLTADKHSAFRVNAVHLENRLRDVVSRPIVVTACMIGSSKSWEL
jgi:hypothetical protein